eukprot:Opistho-2@46547
MVRSVLPNEEFALLAKVDPVGGAFSARADGRGDRSPDDPFLAASAPNPPFFGSSIRPGDTTFGVGFPAASNAQHKVIPAVRPALHGILFEIGCLLLRTPRLPRF